MMCIEINKKNVSKLAALTAEQSTRLPHVSQEFKSRTAQSYTATSTFTQVHVVAVAL